MKTMRYRIRVITLLLIISLIAMILWCVHDIWFPQGFSPALPSESPVSSPSVTPENTETPVPTEEGPTPEPLFDTFGL